MKNNRLFLLVSAAILALALLAMPLATAQNQQSGAQVDPQIKTTFVKLGNGVPGVFYEPANPGEKAQIGVFVMHADGDYLTFSACTELSKRGYSVLCANNSTSKGGVVGGGSIDKMMLDAKLGVAWLRKNSAIKKVVLFGHSGGGVLMSSYQNIAENGLKGCQRPEKIVKCPDSLAGLPPADGLMLVDSNFGLPEMMLFSLDPAVVHNNDGQTLNADLDLFNPKNGFNPAGSNYSPEFIRKFQTAEGKRNTELVKSALDRLAVIQSGKGLYSDDEPFDVAGGSFLGGNNRLFAQDVNLLSHTRKAWPLLHPDGTVTTEIVHTVRVPENTKSNTPSMLNGALHTTVHNFLSTYAIRVTPDYSYDADTVHGIEWASSYASPEGNVEGIAVPTLVMGMTAHWEFAAAETIYEHSKSTDKTLAYVEGATHVYTPCTKCGKSPDQFGNTVKTTYDYVDSWLSKKGRF